MSWPFAGTINGTVETLPQDLPMLVTGFTIVPRTTGVVNVYKVTLASQSICIMPFNCQITSGEMYEGTNQVILLATEKIKVQSSVEVDYDFTISNLKEDE